VRPISGGSDPYRAYQQAQQPVVRRDLSPAGSTSLRLVPRADAAPESSDVELSVRLFADGGSITVKRRTVSEGDGTRRTVGIEALVR
jgi:hypothetical protein